MVMLVVVFAAAVLASSYATPLIVRAASKWELYDVPTDGRRVHTHPIPRLGGIGVFLSTALGLAIVALGSAEDLSVSADSWHFLVGLLLGGGVLFCVGLWDDLRGLRPAGKLVAQCAAVAVVFAFGFRIEVLSLGSEAEVALGWLSFPLTLLWVVGVTNAFNLIDGLDGLATGIAIVALATILAVAVLLGNFEVAVVCVALLGALLGFFRFNFSPARIFLGDSGSLFVGFMLAVLSVHGSMKSATAVMIVVPLFALAVPLLDTGIAIGRRWLRGVPLSGADARHIHHRLLAVGMSHRSAALVMYGVAGSLAVLGLLLAFAPPHAVTAVAVGGGFVLLGLLLFGMHHLDYHEFLEAGAVLATGVLRVRRIIRDQIHARDLCAVIVAAESLEHLDAVLTDNASNFGFVGLTVCQESCTRWGRADFGRYQGMTRVWKLDYPIGAYSCNGDDPFVLRIWCDAEEGNRPLGALRVAQILAPSIEAWLSVRGSAPQARAGSPQDPASERRNSKRRAREHVQLARR